jgi:hypothetical protein
MRRSASSVVIICLAALYQFAPPAISANNNKLHLDFEDRFTVSLMGAQLTFIRNEKGEVIELTIDVNSQTIRAKKINNPTPARGDEK